MKYENVWSPENKDCQNIYKKIEIFGFLINEATN